MASATKDKDMATDLVASGADEPGDEKPKGPPPPQLEPEGGGFFHIYKKGQGYWTRMGTALGATLIGGLLANFLYQWLPVWLPGLGVSVARAKPVAIYIIAAFLAAYALVIFWLMN